MQGEPQPGTGEFILLVDDDDAVRTALHGFISGIGHAVVTAGDGAEALDILARMGSSVRLLITDICMPVMDGIDLIRLVRARRPELPIAVITGFADDGQLQSVQSEITVLFRKPVRFAELAAFLGGPGDD